MARERGYAVPPEGPLSNVREETWELKWPKSLRSYSKMAREDSQVKSVLKAVTQPITRTAWYVESNGADDDVVRAVAEDLNLPVKGEELGRPASAVPRRVSFKQHLRRSLKWMLTYGHAYFELVWDIASDTEDGLTHLRKIAPRNPDTITRIVVEDDGGLKEIHQRPRSGRRGSHVIPVDDLLVYLHEDSNDEWVGESILRAAYKHWVLKDRFLRLEDMVLNRNGMGVAVAKGKPGASQESMDRLQRTVEGIRAGSYSGATLEAEEQLQILGTTGQLVSPRPAVEYHDSQIARTALAHALNLDGKGGSYALADVQMDLFFQSLNDIASIMAETANQYLVRKMVGMLTGDDRGPIPVITFDSIEAKRSLTPSDLATLKNAGLIFADPNTENHLRRIYEMPPRQPPEEWEQNQPRSSRGGSNASQASASLDWAEAQHLLEAWIQAKTSVEETRGYG